MNYNRAESNRVTAEDRQRVLAAFDMTDAQPMAIGTESVVYARDDQTVLKLYAGADRLPHLETLHGLYDRLDTSSVDFSLPTIHQITPFGDIIAVVEARIVGTPLNDLLPGLDNTAIDRAQDLYLDTVFRLKDIRIIQPPQTYLLFDDQRLSETATQSFEQFYADFLATKAGQVGQYFQMPDFAVRVAGLVQAFQEQRPAELSLVHGDFFPGNMLVDDALSRTYGVIDFGTFTLFGDTLLDVAGAYGFYEMYHPDLQRIRQRLLPKVLDRLNGTERPIFFRYLLALAILTSDLYAQGPDPRTDHHFQWAETIVSNAHNWQLAGL